MAQISALLVQKPHARETCRDLFKIAVKIEKGKRRASANKTATRKG
jgi:hypothetical protein